jgi:hypothetical protein
VKKPIDADPALRRRGSASETSMTTESTIVSRQHTPWNKGRLIGQKRPLKPKDVWTNRVRLQMERRRRDLAMFNLPIDSKLRGCDLVRLRVDDVFAAGRVRDRATVTQKKTGRPVQFEITEQTRAAIAEWLAAVGSRRGAYLFPSRFRERPHLSMRQYARNVHRWVDRAGLDRSAYGTHPMRRTKPAQIFKKTGNLRAVQLLLGHTKLESTVRYLGIEVDDALAISEQVRRGGAALVQPRAAILFSEDRHLLQKRSLPPHHPVDPFCPTAVIAWKAVAWSYRWKADLRRRVPGSDVDPKPTLASVDAGAVASNK